MKKKTEYRTVNNLEELILKKKIELTQSQGVAYTKKDVMQIIGDHVGLQEGGIKRIAYNRAEPSLKVAIKLAEYFEMTVEEMFKIIESE